MLSITADSDLINSVQIRVSDDTLRIGIEPGLTLERATLRAEITMPELTAVQLSGAVHANIDGFFPQPAIELRASGASSFEADLDTQRLTLHLDGASIALLRGFAATADLEASGASQLELSDLRIEDADIGLSGASAADVSVLEHLDADVSGASSLQYDGDPELGDVDVGAGSSITRR